MPSLGALLQRQLWEKVFAGFRVSLVGAGGAGPKQGQGRSLPSSMVAQNSPHCGLDQRGLQVGSLWPEPGQAESAVEGQVL